MELSNERLLDDTLTAKNEFSNIVFNSNELIDVSQIDFGDDETWLRVPKNNTDVDIQEWLHENFATDLEKSKLKKIDTRTFTRPKRKFNRPSIELYTDTFNNIKTNDSLNNVDVQAESFSENNPIQLETPKFDLTQPINGDPFNEILLNSTGLDSFINMKQPSLVNSMCSSTFSTMMVDSVNQKDDLFQLKLSNHGEQSLLQDMEQPMFQSFTNSYSISSDMQDSFLKKTLPTFNGTLKLQSSKEDLHKSLNNTSNEESKNETFTFVKDVLNETIVDGKAAIENIDPNITFTKQNNNFTKNNKLDETFNKSQEDVLNNTYQKIPITIVQRFLKQNDIDTAYTESNKHDGTFIKELYKNDTIQNNLSPLMDNSVSKISPKKPGNVTIVNGSAGIINENNGSNDSLDRISSISNSSCKMLNMAEVDALIEMQERCLLEASTPIVPKTTTDFLHPKFDSFDENSTKTCSKSESDLSSTDEYMTVGSGFSNNSSTHSLSKDPIRIDKQVKAFNNEVIAAAKPKNIFIANGTTHIFQKKTNLTSLPVKFKGSLSNMKVLDSKLKGSYTNLRPLGTNLPQAPSLNAHITKSNQNISNIVKIAPVSVAASDTALKSKLKAPNKPQIKASGLPRPATGIPRPSSRIPTPSFGRPMSMKPYSTNKPNNC